MIYVFSIKVDVEIISATQKRRELLVCQKKGISQNLKNKRNHLRNYFLLGLETEEK